MSTSILLVGQLGDGSRPPVGQSIRNSVLDWSRPFACQAIQIHFSTGRVRPLANRFRRCIAKFTEPNLYILPASWESPFDGNDDLNLEKIPSVDEASAALKFKIPATILFSLHDTSKTKLLISLIHINVSCGNCTCVKINGL